LHGGLQHRREQVRALPPMRTSPDEFGDRRIVNSTADSNSPGQTRWPGRIWDAGDAEPVCFGSRRHRVRLAGPRRRWTVGIMVISPRSQRGEGRSDPGTVYAPRCGWGVHGDMPLFHSGVTDSTPVGRSLGVGLAAGRQALDLAILYPQQCRGSPTEEAPDSRSGCCGFDSRPRYVHGVVAPLVRAPLRYGAASGVRPRDGSHAVVAQRKCVSSP
jgi:hypothetical protein